MRLLLTSAGIKNPSIHSALLDLLGKPIAESSALCIPTSSYGMGSNQANAAWRFISGQEPECPMIELGWKSMGVLELTALPSMGPDRWVPVVQETDALLVNGGDPMFLAYWMQQSGLAELLPTLANTVYVGLSAGSMIMAPRIGEEFVEWQSPEGGDQTLGLIDFSIFPHLDNPDLPWNTIPTAEKWAAKLTTPAFAIDDQTAFTVTAAGMTVISEGQWRQLTR